MLLAAVLFLMAVSFVVNMLKWLLLLAAVLVALCLLIGWRPHRDSSYR
ncbi:MAG: hypothetical protein WKF73_15765 [Nocardioidaceae bacterium]